MEDRCVCCGEIIPKGRQVCPNCEYIYGLNDRDRLKFYEELLSAYNAFGLRDLTTKEITDYIIKRQKETSKK